MPPCARRSDLTVARVCELAACSCNYATERGAVPTSVDRIAQPALRQLPCRNGVLRRIGAFENRLPPAPRFGHLKSVEHASAAASSAPSPAFRDASGAPSATCHSEDSHGRGRAEIVGHAGDMRRIAIWSLPSKQRAAGSSPAGELRNLRRSMQRGWRLARPR
jgi:hypothetical protein